MKRCLTVGSVAQDSPVRRRVSTPKAHVVGVPFSMLSQERFGISHLQAVLSFSPLHRTLTPQERYASLSRIRTNKALALASPAARRTRIRCLSRLRDRRLSEAKASRSLLFQANKDLKLTKIQRKSERFELRRRFSEVSQVGNCWILTIVAVASLALAWKRIQQRRRLHFASRQLLNWLRKTCKCIGRLQLIRRRRRQKRALAMLGKLIPSIRRWLKARRMVLRHLVVAALSKGLSKALLQILMRRCLNSVSSNQVKVLQHAARRMLRRVKWCTKDAIRQWKAADSSIITNEVRVLFIRRARSRLLAADRHLRALYPTRRSRELPVLRCIRLHSEDIRSIMAEYKHFLLAASLLEAIPKPITAEVISTVLQARISASSFPRSQTFTNKT